MSEAQAGEHKPLACSFCGKTQREVRKLIAGPTVYICDECIGLCNDIIAEEVKREAEAPAEALAPGETESVSTLLVQLDRKLREVEALRQRLAKLTGV